MKPTAHRVRKLVEKYEREVMNPALDMIRHSPGDGDDDFVGLLGAIEEDIFKFHYALMTWYDELSEPKQ